MSSLIADWFDSLAAQFRKLAYVPDGSLVPTGFMSEEIELTTTGVYVLIAPVALKMGRVPAVQWMITAKDGTVTTAPTFKWGTNATSDNCGASQTPAGFTSQNVDTCVFLASINPTPANLDLTTYGVRLEVTSPAVLGTATVLKARFAPAAGVQLASY